MATNHVITVKIQLEGLGLSGTGGGGSSGGAGAGGPPVDLNIDELRRAFSELAANVRTIAESLRGVSERTASTGGSADTGAEREATRASEASATADEEKAKAAKAAAEATDEATEAERKKAQAEREAADATDATRKAYEELHKVHVQAQQAAGKAVESTEDLVGAVQGFAQRVGGEKSPIALFLQNLSPAAASQKLREQAQQLSRGVESFFRVSKDASPEQAEKAQAKIERLGRLIREAATDLDKEVSAVDVSRIFNKLGGAIKDGLTDLNNEIGKVVSFDSSGLVKAAQSRQFVNISERINSTINQFSKALAEGAGPEILTPLRRSIEDQIEDLKRIAAKGLPKSLFPDEVNGFISSEIKPAGQRSELNQLQKTALEFVRTTIQVQQPLAVVQNLFKLLAGDLNNFEDNLRIVREELKNNTDISQLGGDVRNRQRLTELLGLSSVKRTASGAIRAPSAVTPDVSAIFNVDQINQLKSQLVGLGRGASLERVLGLTDAAGNIRRVQVSLTQLGNTLDTIRVKARDVSDNMFDRASVSTALQRVAVWGAAAGIVFGAVNAFKNAVDIVVSTEASVTALAKVMDESRADLEGFKKTAIDTALRISQDFGQPLKDVLQTMITFGQQGLTFPDVKNLTQASALAAVVTTLDQPTAASALTAATQQFGIAASDATSIVDKFNNVANNAAVTETDLAEAIKRAGIAAVNAGVDIDQFNGIVAAISEQTRQSGAEIGTALRFIFSRLSSEDAERGLAKVGVAIKDAQGNIRPFVDIITDLRNAFSGLSESQQTQAAIAIADSRRFNTFLALLQNFDRFQESAANSASSAGSALEEQSKVAETAAFRITQLKNSLAATAVSFGDVFLPPIKIAIEGLRGLLDVVSDIPDSFKAAGVAVAGAAIAFTKFSAIFVDIAANQVPGGAGVFATLAGALTQGQTRANQLQQSPGQFTALQAAGTAGEAVIAARGAGDFAGFFSGSKGAKAFADSLKESNLVLLDTNNKVIKAEAGITKFSAATRGFKIGQLDKAGDVITATAIPLAAVNSGLGKVAATAVRASNSILRFSFIPAILTAAELKAASFNATLGRSVTVFSSLLRVIGAGVTIFALVRGLQELGAIATRTGADIKKSLEPELAERQQLINKLKQQRSELAKLADEERRVGELRLSFQSQLDNASQPGPLIRERVRRGEFESPELAERQLRERRQRSANDIGFANPQLIQSVDKFGNVVLKGADAFDKLAESAVSAQERLQAFTQLRVIEGFIKDLEPGEGALRKIGRAGAEALSGLTLGLADFTEEFDTIGDNLNQALEGIERFKGSSVNALADALGVDINILDPDFAEEQREAFNKVSVSASAFEEAMARVREEIKRLPADTAGVLSASDDIQKFFETLAQSRQALGEDVTAGDLFAQASLQNKSNLQKVGNLIQARPQDTVESFRQAGFVGESFAVDAASDIRDTLARELKGGEFIVFDALFGRRQGEVAVNELGERMVTTLNKAGDRIEEIRLADILNTDGVERIFSFIPRQIEEQLNRSLLETQRIAVGAGRGIFLQKDLDLGAGRGFQLTAQQRASRGDEILFSDALRQQKEFETQIETFKNSLEELSSGAVTADLVNQINKLAREFDQTTTIIRFREEIEKVGISFEQAIDELQGQSLGELIRAQFSNTLGAGRGIVSPTFERPLLQSELSAEQRFAQRNPGTTQLGNFLTASRAAVGETLANAQVARRNIDIAGDLFSSASAAGGARDPLALGQLFSDSASRIEGGLTESQALQHADSLLINEKATEQVRLLADISNTLKNQPEAIGGVLAGRLTQAQGAPEVAEAVTQQLEKLSSDQLGAFRTSDLNTIVSSLGTGAPGNVQDELIRRRAVRAATGINESILTDLLGPGLSGGASGGLFSGVSQAIQKVIPTSGQAAVRQEQEILVRSLKDAGLLERPSAEITDDVVRQVAASFVDRLGQLDPGRGASAAVALGAGGEQSERFLSEVRNQIQSIQRIVAEEQRPPVERPERDVRDEQRKANQSLQAFSNSLRATETKVEALDRVLIVSRRLGEAIEDASIALRNNFISAIDEARLQERFGQLLAPEQAGALAGVSALNLGTGQRFKDLGGADVARLSNPELVNAANKQVRDLNSINASIASLTAKERELKDIREDALAAGDTAGAQRATETLDRIGNVMSLLSSQGEGATGSMRRLGDALKNLEDTDQLSQDINKIFLELRKGLELDFDRTSIDTALGNTVFSLVRPTFEQFEQGQKGFATQFERTIASIEERQRSGQLSPFDARRETRQAEFERDEGIIDLAQKRETNRLQTEIQAAEQIRDRLFDFASLGTSQSGVAKGLIDELTRELESAGDIVKTNIGRRTIRNPLTGRDEEVPASQILAFKGLPSLGRLQDQVAALGQAAKAEENAKNATLINEPIVSTLQDLLGESNRLLSDISKEIAGDQQSQQKDLANLRDVRDVETAIPDLIKFIQSARTGLDPAGREAGARGLETLERIVNAGGGKALDTTQIDAGQGVKSVTNALADVIREGKGVDDALKARVEGILGGLEENIVPAAEALSSLKKSAEELVVTFSAFSSLNAVNKTADKFASGGLISGPGGPRSDTIPILASPGEFVLNAAAVKRIGLSNLARLNGIQGFKDGGFVQFDAQTLSPEELAKLILEQQDAGDERIAAIKERLAKVPTIEALDKRRIRERNRVDNQRTLGGPRLTSADLLRDSGFFVEEGEGGRLKFTNIPSGGAVRIGDNLQNITLNGSEAFGKELKRRQDVRKALTQDQQARKALESELTEARRDKQLREEKVRASDQVASARAIALAKLSRNTIDEVAAISRPVAQLDDIYSKFNTAEGREHLRLENLAARAVISDIKTSIGAFNDKFEVAQRKALRLRNPLTGNLEDSAPLVEMLTTDDGFVDSLTGDVFGQMYLGGLSGETLERLRIKLGSSQYRDYISGAEAIIESIGERNSDPFDPGQAFDVIDTSELPGAAKTTLKVAGAPGLAVLGAGRKAVVGSVHGIGETSDKAFSGDVGGLLKSVFVDPILGTGEALGTSAAALSQSKNIAEGISNFSDVLLAGAGAAGITAGGTKFGKKLFDNRGNILRVGNQFVDSVKVAGSEAKSIVSRLNKRDNNAAAAIKDSLDSSANKGPVLGPALATADAASAAPKGGILGALLSTTKKATLGRGAVGFGAAAALSPLGLASAAGFPLTLAAAFAPQLLKGGRSLLNFFRGRRGRAASAPVSGLDALNLNPTGTPFGSVADDINIGDLSDAVPAAVLDEATGFSFGGRKISPIDLRALREGNASSLSGLRAGSLEGFFGRGPSLTAPRARPVATATLQRLRTGGLDLTPGDVSLATSRPALGANLPDRFRGGTSLLPKSLAQRIKEGILGLALERQVAAGPIVPFDRVPDRGPISSSQIFDGGDVPDIIGTQISEKFPGRSKAARLRGPGGRFIAANADDLIVRNFDDAARVLEEAQKQRLVEQGTALLEQKAAFPGLVEALRAKGTPLREASLLEAVDSTRAAKIAADIRPDIERLVLEGVVGEFEAVRLSIFNKTLQDPIVASGNALGKRKIRAADATTIAGKRGVSFEALLSERLGIRLDELPTTLRPSERILRSAANDVGKTKKLIDVIENGLERQRALQQPDDIVSLQRLGGKFISPEDFTAFKEGELGGTSIPKGSELDFINASLREQLVFHEGLEKIRAKAGLPQPLERAIDSVIPVQFPARPTLKVQSLGEKLPPEDIGAASTLNLGNSPTLQQFIDPADLIKTVVDKEGLPGIKSPEFKKLFEELRKRKGFASGGAIFGAGGPRGDRIPILASNGEFVMNADTVRRLGLPFMHALNSGKLPGFADGGEVTVGPSSRGQSTFDVKVNAQEISSAISNAITTSFERIDLSFDSEGVVNAISDAIATAFASIELPEVQINSDNVTVPLDIPAAGIPIDTSSLQGLNLGDNVGAAIRNRLEAVEGTVESLREDANTVLDTLTNLDAESLKSLPTEMEALKNEVSPLDTRLTLLEDNLVTQHDQILNEVFTLVNEQINNLQFGDDIEARLQRHMAQTAAEFAGINISIAAAVDTANRALSQALAR